MSTKNKKKLGKDNAQEIDVVDKARFDLAENAKNPKLNDKVLVTKSNTNVKEINSLTKALNNLFKEENKNKSREQKRQDAFEKDLMEEIDRINKRLSQLAGRLYDLDANELTSIDRDLLVLELTTLESYQAALSAIFDYETVRIRRRNGEYLQRTTDNLKVYLLGNSWSVEKRLGGTSAKHATCAEERLLNEIFNAGTKNDPALMEISAEKKSETQPAKPAKKDKKANKSKKPTKK